MTTDEIVEELGRLHSRCAQIQTETGALQEDILLLRQRLGLETGGWKRFEEEHPPLLEIVEVAYETYRRGEAFFRSAEEWQTAIRRGWRAWRPIPKTNPEEEGV